MKQKPGTRSRTRCDGRRPEWLGRDTPGPFKDLRQDQHGHVATHAVALPGDRSSSPIIACCSAGLP